MVTEVTAQQSSSQCVTQWMWQIVNVVIRTVSGGRNLRLVFDLSGNDVVLAVSDSDTLNELQAQREGSGLDLAHVNVGSVMAADGQMG